MASAYTETLFAEDSPLAGAWLAANAVDKRLSKHSKDKIYNTSIKDTTKVIEQLTQVRDSMEVTDSSQIAFQESQDLGANGEIKLPLRLSSQLLYGVVRIYSNKATTLHGEVSSELKQINKIFSVNKNITMDPKEIKLNDGLKDQLTMENLIDSVNDFNIDEVFGTQAAAPIDDVWTAQSTYTSTVSDVDVGRNAEADESMVSSIDDVPRRAGLERPDDLEGVDGLDLDLNFEKNAPADNEIDMPDFTVPDFGEGFDNAEFDGGFDAPLEEEPSSNLAQNTIASYVEEESITSTRRRKRMDKLTVEYQINNVVRTKSKKLILDYKIDRSANDVRENQSKFEANLKLQRLNNFKIVTDDDELVLSVFRSLQPELLNMLSTNWKTIKKRKLENGNSERTAEIEEYIQNNDGEETTGFNVPNMDIDVSEPVDFDVPELASEVTEADNEQEFDEESDEDEFELVRASNKSSIKVAECLRNNGESSIKLETVINNDLLSTNKRKNATRTFFEMLVLATLDTVKINQDRLFGEVEIESTPNLYQKFL